MIHVSTDQVYDGQGSEASGENDTAPVNAYGRSKLAGEQALTSKTCVLRTNFVGKSHLKKSMTDWIIEKTDSGEGITGFSDVYFSPIAMNTLVSMIDRCIDQRPPGYESR